MDEYIKRKAVISLITRRYENPEICTQEINQIPVADVAAVVHGRWENVYGDFSTAECVVCKSQFEVTFERESNKALWNGFCQFYRYCPNCGARMDGEQNEQPN